MASISQSDAGKNEKYLTEAIDMESICPYGKINIVSAPVGSGKTSWALDVFSQIPSFFDKVLYLIDTRNGNQSISKHPNAMMYSDEWLDAVEHNIVYWDEHCEINKVAVITYAKFGVLTTKYNDFIKRFDIIICDELHSLPKFAKFRRRLYSPDELNWHEEAIKSLKRTVVETRTMVVALTATPKAAEKEFKELCNNVSVDEDVRQFNTKQINHYANLDEVLNEIPASQRGMLPKDDWLFLRSLK